MIKFKRLRVKQTSIENELKERKKLRILKDFKIPNFKFPKLKMDNLSKIDNVEVNYEDVKKAEEYKKRRKKENYPTTSYTTIKEIFEKNIQEFSKETAILEKFNPKEKFTEITYEQFGNDVINFGTALTKKLCLKDKRIVDKISLLKITKQLNLLSDEMIKIDKNEEYLVFGSFLVVEKFLTLIGYDDKS